jgi:hypothetical protein
MIEASCAVDQNCDRQFFEKIPRRLVEFEAAYHEHVVRLMEKFNKPVLGVGLLSDGHSRTVTEVDGSRYKGISFLTPERAVKALAGMCSYKQWLRLEGV